ALRPQCVFVLTQPTSGCVGPNAAGVVTQPLLQGVVFEPAHLLARRLAHAVSFRESASLCSGQADRDLRQRCVLGAKFGRTLGRGSCSKLVRALADVLTRAGKAPWGLATGSTASEGSRFAGPWHLVQSSSGAGALS